MQPDHKGKSSLPRPMLAKIHIAAKALGLAEEDYRDLLGRVTGKRSASDLALSDLPALQQELRRCGWDGYLISYEEWQAGKPAPQKKYQELGYRTGRPNPAQLRKLDALFHGIPGYGTISPEKAFRAFLRKRFGIEDAAFLDLIQYEKALKAVREMRKRHGMEDGD